MPYPPIYTRLFNFLRDQNNGLVSPAAAKVDAELNNLQLSLAQAIERLRTITTVDGKLRNVPSALAAALVDTWEGVSNGTVTVTTTIPYLDSFSTSSLLVLVSGVPLRPAQILSRQDSGGFLQLTLAAPAPALNALLVVWAFEPGAGVVTRLASTAQGDGADLVGVHDAGNFFGSTTVEGALSEIAGSFLSLQQALGDLADYFKRDGTITATGDFDMGGNKVTNADDGVDPGDYLTVRQMANYIAAWSDLSRFFLKRDGTTAMAGNLNFGNSKGVNLADPDLNSPLDAVNVRTVTRIIAVSGASPIGSIIDYIGDVVPSTDWLLCDGQVYAATAYPILAGILPTAYRQGAKQGCATARFPETVAGVGPTPGPGDVVAGALVVGDIKPLFQNLGRGYASAPVVTVQNPDGSTPTGVSIQVTVTPTVVDGATVQSGGVIETAQILTGGSGAIPVQVGAVLLFSNTLEVIPAGYFRTPDMRGRVTISAGTESMTPGVVDPPALINGNTYDATPRVMGDFGGVEKHTLTVAEMPYHNHPAPIQGGRSRRERDGGTGTEGYGGTGYAGGSVPHPNIPPFHVLNKIIKAK